MRQELSTHMEIYTEDEFNHKDSYYSAVSDYQFMDVIHALIEDITHPVFIVQNSNRVVYALNEEARRGFNGVPVTNSRFDSLLNVYDLEIDGKPIVFFNHTWYMLSQEAFDFKGDLYLKVELLERKEVPDSTTLDRWKNMIAVMLHRFRSPLTGIAGYVDMLVDETEGSSSEKHVAKVEYGVNQLCDIMDELEFLYHIPSKFDVSKLSPIDVSATIQRVLLSCGEQDRKRVHVLSNSNAPVVEATSQALERVLTQLLNNALQNSVENSPVTVAAQSDKIIRISNEHPGIPDDIQQHLFFPFVTSRANNLGIGLTIALLFASQFGGTIFQTENGENNRVTFALVFP